MPSGERPLGEMNRANETNELLNTTNLCSELETRSWNDPRTNTRSYVNASTLGILYSPVMILQPSDIYFRTFGANATTLLGFNQSIVDTPISPTNIFNKKTEDYQKVLSQLNLIVQFRVI